MPLFAGDAADSQLSPLVVLRHGCPFIVFFMQSEGECGKKNSIWPCFGFQTSAQSHCYFVHVCSNYTKTRIAMLQSGEHHPGHFNGSVAADGDIT